ncbi:hypothetical protein CLIB1444_01S19130 [[Candida] jaroonii]|uniref:Uncharacterized protein n=1 Tax=[Candida] jaroonii TaxID=467808 RepID=A0ACA9Y233_9ASCO|nr:hypothetical protein CLIB1444_01S19130 [[Candida] jaroonii]
MLRTIRYFSSSSVSKVNYGFIGLGQMGQHMARHIYDKLENDKLYVYDVSQDATNTFIQSVTSSNSANSGKINQLSSISDFIKSGDEQLDYIITMVPEGKHVKAVIEELVSVTKKGSPSKKTTFLDSSTIDIPTSIEIHKYVKSEIPEFDFVDAPVSGGVAGAKKGTLSFMLSRADDESITSELRSLLNKMAKNIFPCGSNHGTGLAAKLSNNYLLAVTNLAVADSFQLAKSFGLDLHKYAKLVSVSTGKSWASVDNCPIPDVYSDIPSNNGYKGGFVTKLTRKDLVLATASAAKNGRFLYLGDIGKFWYDKACEEESIASRDLAVLYEWLEGIDEEKGNALLKEHK